MVTPGNDPPAMTPPPQTSRNLTMGLGLFAPSAGSFRPPASRRPSGRRYWPSAALSSWSSAASPTRSGAQAPPTRHLMGGAWEALPDTSGVEVIHE